MLIRSTGTPSPPARAVGTGPLTPATGSTVGSSSLWGHGEPTADPGCHTTLRAPSRFVSRRMCCGLRASARGRYAVAEGNRALASRQQTRASTPGARAFRPSAHLSHAPIAFGSGDRHLVASSHVPSWAQSRSTFSRVSVTEASARSSDAVKVTPSDDLPYGSVTTTSSVAGRVERLST